MRKGLSLVWGDLWPEEITTLVVEEFREQALKARLSPRTINQQIGHAARPVREVHGWVPGQVTLLFLWAAFIVFAGTAIAGREPEEIAPARP